MNEGYKLIVTKVGRYGVKKSMSSIYPLRQECLISLEDDFERWKKEPDVVELHLLRLDANRVNELRRYVR